jgi:hypothetical protein
MVRRGVVCVPVINFLARMQPASLFLRRYYRRDGEMGGDQNEEKRGMRRAHNYCRLRANAAKASADNGGEK